MATPGNSNVSILPEEIRGDFESASESGSNVFHITIHYSSEMLENGYDPAILLGNLQSASACYRAFSSLDIIPVIDAYEPFTMYLDPEIFVHGDLSAEDITDLALEPDLMEVERIGSGPDQKSLEKALKIDAEALQEFILGSSEMLDSAEKVVIEYEKSGSKEALNEIFRVVHTIKGDADFIGIKSLASFSHSLESVLGALRSGQQRKTPSIIDLILQSLDFFRQSLKTVSEGRTVIAPEELQRKVTEALPVTDEPGVKKVLPLPSGKLESVFLEQAMQYREIIGDALRNRPWTDQCGTNLLRALHSLSLAADYIGLRTLSSMVSKAMSLLATEHEQSLIEELGSILAFLDGLHVEPKRLGEILIEDGILTKEEIDDALRAQQPLGEILIKNNKATREEVEKALKKQEIMEAAKQLRPSATAESEARTMRVSEQKIEQFTNLIGELLIAKNSYEYLLKKLDNSNGDRSHVMKSLQENLRLFSRLSNDMHHGVMSLRMIPIKGIFNKFNRVIRDISRKQKKDIDLITEGEEIEIDKKVGDLLTDPLVHLIRNSCDHGIETQIERRQAGKPEKGTILLRASQEGSNLTIRVIDDGRGIDRQQIYDKAVRKGIEVESPDSPDIYNLIFSPGFSTKEEVTELSGRGVGMDVVRTTIQSLGGNVQVNSEKNHGTEMVLSIPMTMGISNVLLIEADDNCYALPLDSIEETLKIHRQKLKYVGKSMLFHYRGEVLSAVKLQTMLGKVKSGNKSVPSSENEEELSVVIVKSRRGKFGMIVDRFLRNMEIAVKPVPKSLSDIKLISGTSIMGDGRILLILNPENLFTDRV